MPPSLPPTEQIITIQNGKILVPDHPTIPFIEGDGIGPEITQSTQAVVNAAVTKAYHGARSIQWTEVFAGEKAERLFGSNLPEETLEKFKYYHIGLKGPLNTPVGEGMRSLNVAVRKELDLYVNYRPVKYYPPAPSPLVHPERVNIALFRENTEDVYSGIEFESGTKEAMELLDYLKTNLPESYARVRFPESSAVGLKPISREGSQRIVRAAIEHALQYKRNSVSLLHKGNIMKFTEGGFMNWGYDLAETEYADRTYSMRRHKRLLNQKGEEAAGLALQTAKAEGRIIVKDMIVDAAFERCIAHPEDMDVLVTTNLNGDYLSDALAALVGGLGIAPGANISYESGNAIFEAVHGTAPEIAGKNIANPCSMILTCVLMMRYLNWIEAADLVENSLSQTFAGNNVTPDFACQMTNATSCSTTQFTSLLLERI